MQYPDSARCIGPTRHLPLLDERPIEIKYLDAVVPSICDKHLVGRHGNACGFKELARFAPPSSP